jgi:hypothetical protein
MKKHECGPDCYYWLENIKHPRFLTERQKELVRKKLRGLGRGWYMKKSVVARLATRFRVSESTIYKHSKGVRPKKSRRGKSTT